MSARRKSVSKTRKARSDVGGRSVVFKCRDTDTVNTVSGSTLRKLATELGYTETQVLHFAAARLARSVLPAYPRDDRALSDAQVAALRKLHPQGAAFEESLF
jgi:hypothetical protein